LKALSFHQVRARIGVYVEEDLKSNDFVFIRRLEVEQESENLIKISVEVQGDSGVVHFATYRGNY
ncbi:MAG: type II secretion system protein, partial [Tepidanaerobacteraceae bacterium]